MPKNVSKKNELKLKKYLSTVEKIKVNDPKPGSSKIRKGNA